MSSSSTRTRKIRVTVLRLSVIASVLLTALLLYGTWLWLAVRPASLVGLSLRHQPHIHWQRETLDQVLSICQRVDGNAGCDWNDAFTQGADQRDVYLCDVIQNEGVWEAFTTGKVNEY